MDWTPETIDYLRERWSQGASTRQIGVELNCTKNSIVSKAHRLNLPPRPSPIRKKESKASPRPERLSRVSPSHAAVLRQIVITEVSRNQCSWPVGMPKREGFHFCPEKALIGRPYCQAHCDMAYVGKKENV